MSCCEDPCAFISLYFYKNGSCCKPERVRVRKNEIDRTIQKEARYCYYRGFRIYTLTGECIKTLSSFSHNCAYVLVEPMECFKQIDYSKTFNDFKKILASRRSAADQKVASQSSKCNSNFRKCQSQPAIPISCRSEQSVTFAQSCSEEDDDDVPCPCDDLPRDECQIYATARKKKPPMQKPPSSPPRPKSKQRKLFGKSKTKAGQCLAKPMIECGNGKMTQTTNEDFKCSMSRMKKAIADERRRQRLYKRKPARQQGAHCSSNAKPAYCPADDDEDELEDPKNIRKIEAEREKFHQKRAAMENRISKALDRKYKNLLYDFC